MTQNIYGTIGYTILKNDNHNVIVFADMHDQLLEEVYRNTDFKLKELWTTFSSY